MPALIVLLIGHLEPFQSVISTIMDEVYYAFSARYKVSEEQNLVGNIMRFRLLGRPLWCRCRLDIECWSSATDGRLRRRT